MNRLLMLVLLVPLVACGDPPEVDFGGEDLGRERFEVVSRDGELKMGLTDAFVYFALSDSVIADVREDVRAKREEGNAFLGGVLESAVGKALGFRLRVPVAEIRDIRWEDGVMRFEFFDPDRRLGDQFEVDHEPVTEAFGEDEVRAFSRAFRDLTRSATQERAEERGR